MPRESAFKWLIITDLDGTLLDHEDYSLAPALGTIQRLKKRKIPLIFCSSKTAAEIRKLQEQVGVSDPFIAENGGAVYLDDLGNPQSVIEIGTEAALLERALFEMAEILELSLTPITRMTNLEIMEMTGLAEEDAQLARQRAYSLPFVSESPDIDWTALEEEARKKGFNLTRGGRFAHLIGDNDKGKAVNELVAYWSRLGSVELRTVGLGDSQNDLSMLMTVTLPIRILNPGSTAPLSDELDWAFEVDPPGPKGWKVAIEAFLDRYS